MGTQDDGIHYASIKTEVECGVLRREDLRKVLDEIEGIHTGYPLQVSHTETPVHQGVYSKFIISLKGKPEMVEDLAYKLDDLCRSFSLCLHEKLQIN